MTRRTLTCDVGVGIEVFDHERTQVLGVASGDVQDEIVGAGQKVDIHHLPFAADLLDEAADFPASGRLQVDRDHRLQRQTHRDRVDVGVEPPDHAEVHQPPNPAVTRRRRYPDSVR